MVKAEFFCAENGVVVSIDLGWLQLVFDTLMGISYQVGLRKNVCKTVGRVCRPFRAARVRVDGAYTRRVTREGRSFKEWERERVICPECGKELARGSLLTHHQTQNGVYKGG